DGPAGGGRIASRRRQRDGPDCAPLPGGRVMARAATHSRLSRRRSWWAALVIFAAVVTVVAGSAGGAPAPGPLPAITPPAEAARQARTIAGADARSRRGDQLRLHQRARLGGRQRSTLFWQLHARSRPGDLRPENQAAACRRKCAADRR